MIQDYTFKITVKEIYGKEVNELTPPKGYKFTDFRPPEPGDKFFDEFDYTVRTTVITWTKYSPRLILAQIQTIIPGFQAMPGVINVHDIYGGDVTIPEGYKFVAFNLITRFIGKEFIQADTYRNLQKCTEDYPVIRIIVEKNDPNN